MTPIEDQARLLFLAALARSPNEWSSFLAESCEENPTLRARVDELLNAHAAMASAQDSETGLSIEGFEESAMESVGSLIGSYRLLERIGEGGFGIVYMAEQITPVRRKVALKIIKPGMDTRQVVARFEAERQALALMDHPNIAQIFDGGTTTIGRSFFVMELVRGVPITEFCDENALSIRERLELFVVVCNAVQHAHQKGIIHRDIKPNNVMVTRHDDRRVVKVIDFGIAKAVGQQLTEKTLFTNFSQFIGTPPYMSPEQAQMSGLDIDTRSDIYSLGVLLYELLTGTTPFDKQRLRTVAFDEIRRIIREEEPPKPSTRLHSLGDTATTVSAQRGSDSRQLRDLLRRELDWVVMKCLEKNRNRRYETANGLALDVQRYLKNQPISACPPSIAYRVRSFTRRHRAALTTAALVLAIAMFGGATTIWQAFRAATARDEALKSKLKLSENQQIAAEERANTFARDLETLGSANRLIQSGRFHFDMGEYARAQTDVSAAIDIRPDHSYAWLARGEFYSRLGLWDLAVSDYQRGYQLREPETISLLSQQAVFRFHCGDKAGYRGVCERLATRAETLDPRECDEISRACLLVDRSVLDPEQLIRLAERSVGTSRRSVQLANLGVAHYRAEQYERAIERLHEARARSRPNSVWTDSVLAMVHHRLGQNELARKYLDSATDSLNRDLYSPGVRLSFTWWYNLLAELYYREASQLIEGKPRTESVEQWMSRGEKLAALGLNSEALASYDHAVEVAPGSASGWEKKAALHAQLGQWEQAVGTYDRLLSLQPDRADVVNTLSGLLASCPEPKFRQPDRAVELAGKAVGLAPHQAAYWRTLGIARYRAKDLRGSELAMLKAMELNPAGHPVDRLFLAMALWNRDRKRQAEQMYLHTMMRDDWPAEMVEELSRYSKEAAELLGRPEKPAPLRGAHWDEDPSIATILLEIDPEATWLYERRGFANAMLKQWDQAAADFQRAAAAHPDDPRLWYARAAAKLGANDLQSYREIREEIFSRYGKTPIPAVANHMLYISLITPVTNESEADTLVRWGNLAIRLTPDNPRARGAAYYRSGKYESAVNDLTEAAKSFPPRAWDSLFLAMAQEKLGHARESREALKKAEEWLERANRSGSSLASGPWIGWYESVEVAHLLREARAMIKTNQ